MERTEKLEKLRNYRKALFNVDMVEGFVNFGAMANPGYNELVPEQMRILDDFIKEQEAVMLIGEWHDKDAREFDTYPAHCIKETDEAEFIPEIRDRVYEQNEQGILLRKKADLKPNVYDYGKNSINGFLNPELRGDVVLMENLDVAVFNGVCEDLCVCDAARTFARLMDEINRNVRIYVMANAVDTFDLPGHDRGEYKKLARMVMEQAGIKYVENYDELLEVEEKIRKRK